MIDPDKLRDLVFGLDGDAADLPFWQACERHEFLLQQCGVCRRHYWPAAKCVDHGGQDMRWVQASGRGEVHVWIIQHVAHNPDWRAKVPYNLCVIKLDEGPFFHSNIVDCPNEAIHTGLKVEVTFQDHPNGMTIPVFRRVDD